MARNSAATAAICIASCLLFSACSTSPTKPLQFPQWEERVNRLESLQNWKLEGKIAYRGENKSESASISWHQNSSDSAVRLSGPIGLGATTLHSDGSTLRIHRGGESQDYDVSSADNIRRELGWDFPLESLPSWLKGIPQSEAPVESREIVEGKLTKLQQSGWSVSYTGYQRQGTLELPRKIQFENANTTVRLIVRRWNTEPEQ